MTDYQPALIWITSLLKKLNIPFQIAGGLGAIAHGATRSLYDIDFDIPEDQFSKLQEAVKDYVIFGPEQYQDEHWDLLLMTLEYHGQLIDFGGADDTKVFDQKTKQWHPIPVDFSQSEIKLIAGLQLPVVPLAELIRYKTLLDREVDRADLAELTNYEKN